MKPLAKTSGILLEDHIRHLLDETERALHPRSFVQKKYSERTGEDIVKAVKHSSRWHDEGKTDSVWQTACQKDHEELKRIAQRAEVWCVKCQKEHEVWQAKREVYGRHLRQVGMRHEMASLEIMQRKKENVAFPVRVAVAAHHGKLSHKHKDRWQDRRSFEPFWDEFFAEAKSIRTSDREGFDKAIAKRYKVAGPRALLQLVDHRASAFESGEALPDFTPFSYTFPAHWTKTSVQQEIEKLWDEPFAILRAPTGSGKTDAALLWAQHQIECERADRLVMAMPTRFTANAVAISKAEDLSATGLYHSSAWYQRIKGIDGLTPQEDRFIKKEQELARKLEMPFTVTTIDHLCICLTGTREDHHAIFFSLAHSCVVIDEADFYDDFTQQNIVLLLKALRLLNVPTLLMSATVPESAKQVYAESGFTISAIYEDKFDYERPRCFIKKQGKAAQLADVAEILERGLNGTPLIIYANTVRRAQEYYRWFQSKGCDEAEVVLYHSRFTEPHKALKEKQLAEMLGRGAWEDGTQYGIAILTQIGEISVNISADLMLSDICPLDRLAQRAGRLARFKQGEKIGELFVVEPYRLNKKTQEVVFYPAPYGHFDGQKWQTGEALSMSMELLQDGLCSPKSFVDLVNAVYPSAKLASPEARDNRELFEQLVVNNWLILPQHETQEDDDHFLRWRSRDIPPQYTVYADYEISPFVEEYDRTFRNKSEFREFQLCHGIQCYAYEFTIAKEKSYLTEALFSIGEESKEELWIVRSPYYDFAMGLHFDDETEDY